MWRTVVDSVTVTVGENLIRSGLIRACLFASIYIGVNGEINSTKRLLKRWGVKDTEWHMKDIRLRCKYDIHFSMYLITRIMAGYSFPSLFLLFYFSKRKCCLILIFENSPLIFPFKYEMNHKHSIPSNTNKQVNTNQIIFASMENEYATTPP